MAENAGRWYPPVGAEVSEGSKLCVGFSSGNGRDAQAEPGSDFLLDIFFHQVAHPDCSSYMRLHFHQAEAG